MLPIVTVADLLGGLEGMGEIKGTLCLCGMPHLNIYLKNYWEAQEDEFEFVDYESHFTTEEPCNIYLVGIRPRVIIDPNRLKCNGQQVDLVFKVQEKFDFKEIEARLTLDREVKGKLQIETTEPFSTFNLRDEKGYFFDKQNYSQNPNIAGKSFYALRQTTFKSDVPFNDLELLYIGKSLRMDKKISPVKRLRNHEKVQKILSKCTKRYFDKEVYILLCSFVKKIDFMAPSEHLQKFKDGEHLRKKIQRDIKALNATKELTTQIAEAILIDYFNTSEFNKDFIGSFGRKTHSYYSAIKDSEISTIGMEIDLTNLCRIYSQTVSPSNYHMVKYFPKDSFSRKTSIEVDEYDKY